MRTVLIKHFASGQAFFMGVALLCLVAWLTERTARRRRWTTVGWCVGLLLIGASSTPLPTSYSIFAALMSLAWIISLRPPGRKSESNASIEADAAETQDTPRRTRWVTGLFVIVWLVGAAMELPCHVMPTIPPAAAVRLTIFADSVTAGIGEREAITWPELFSGAHAVDVVDHARMGATAASATVLAEQHPPEPGIVLLEIGGNDLLGHTSAPDFERTLSELLEAVSGPGRQVVMLELPLPPLMPEYGRIQRRLAKRYNVTLIPKRFLLGVLLSDSTTLDSIHLSQAGHQRMADQMWELLEPCY